MKRIRLLIVSVLILMLTACGGSAGGKNKAAADSGSGSGQNSGSDLNGGVDQDSADGISAGADGKDNEIAIEGVYIENSSCGYISNNPRPEPYVLYLITDEADLEAAETKLGIAIHEDTDGNGQYYTTHINVLQNIMKNYPLECYVYLFEYLEYASLGHHCHADGVVYRDEALYFHYDVMESPGEDSVVCDAMDGEFIVAAIPKDAIKDKTFSYNVRPSRMESSDTIQFSNDTMFTMRIYEPWFYESLHYTLKSDGTLIVLYYDTELGREQLSEDRMNAIKEVFSPEKVYDMDVGIEDCRTDGTSRYIILYDAEGNEIQVGGYELVGGDNFDHYFDTLYQMLEDDYTKQFSDKLDECAQECVTYKEKYLTP